MTAAARRRPPHAAARDERLDSRIVGAATEIDESHALVLSAAPRSTDTAKAGVRDTRETMISHPPARHLLRAKDLIDARYRDALDVPALARAAHLSHRALQPRVPQGVRRDAAPVPAHAQARARGGAAAQHRPDGVARSASRSACGASARSRRASDGPTAARPSPTAPPIHRPPTGSESRPACCSPTAGRVEQFWRRQPAEP